MLPIHIFDGPERYLLVRRGTKLGAAAERVEQVDPRRARAVLETALRRQPQLIRELSIALNLREDDPWDVAARLLVQLGAVGMGGMVGADLVLLRVRPSAIVRPDRPAPEPAPAPAPPPPEPTPEEPEDEPPEAKTTIRVSLFFDGTANNRANTLARLLETDAYEDNDDELSFNNDFTNISRLETRLIGDSSFDHDFSIYVEGIGTTDGEGDSTWGMAFGMGDTGVKAKVEAGVNEVLRGIRELGIASGEIIERIHLDAFGFSRGAAAARYFVHFILDSDNPLQPRIEGLGHPVELLEVNFIGLFDTVASYGLDHTNDTSDLSLDAIRAAKKVVQLAAAEEHRKNFPLTDISSAVGGGVGIEIYLPGVHSDVGGGYRDPSEEIELEILDIDQLFSDDALEQRFVRERAWLIDAGWYRPSEIAEVNWWNELKVTRRGICNRYNRIPLHHMADFAAETGLSFDPMSTHHPIPAALAEVREVVAAHVAGHVAGTLASTPDHWLNIRTPAFRTLRHDYLHFSAYYGGIANPPRFIGGPLHGRRQRAVHAG